MKGKQLPGGKEEGWRPRRDHEPPAAVARWGWRYHHLGIPTSIPRRNETHLVRLKIHVSGFKTSPFGIEWMRFEPGCVVSDLVRRVPHIAFEVDDLDAALKGMNLLGEITSPSPGVRVAMIDDGGAPVELIEFARSRRRGNARRGSRSQQPSLRAEGKPQSRRPAGARDPRRRGESRKPRRSRRRRPR